MTTAVLLDYYNDLVAIKGGEQKKKKKSDDKEKHKAKGPRLLPALFRILSHKTTFENQTHDRQPGSSSSCNRRTKQRIWFSLVCVLAPEKGGSRAERLTFVHAGFNYPRLISAIFTMRTHISARTHNTHLMRCADASAHIYREKEMDS